MVKGTMEGHVIFGITEEQAEEAVAHMLKFTENNDYLDKFPAHMGVSGMGLDGFKAYIMGRYVQRNENTGERRMNKLAQMSTMRQMRKICDHEFSRIRRLVEEGRDLDELWKQFGEAIKRDAEEKSNSDDDDDSDGDMFDIAGSGFGRW